MRASLRHLRLALLAAALSLGCADLAGLDLDGLHLDDDAGTDARVADAAHEGGDAADASSLQCSAGKGDCDRVAANGCEVDLTKTVANCGACGNACSTSHATPTCVAGACKFACATGWGDCDGLALNGCEANFATSVAACSGCDNACSTSHSTPGCVGGACQVSCAAGWGDCDLDASNGCEASLTASTSSCGGCGKACSTTHATPSCVASACKLACAVGWGDCDGAVSTGCEASLTNSVAACGGCGKACSTTHATPTCLAGACKLACAVGWGDCDGAVSTGCETSLSTSVAHCGACANACSTSHVVGAACAASVCGGTCEAGWGDCNANKLLDGCETPLGTAANCASCGNGCGAGQNCSAGACVVVPPSCLGSAMGQTDCGPSGNESCCTSLLVAGGTFSRSYDAVTAGYTDAQYQATVSDFKLDKYEITVGRFRKFVDAVVAGWTPTAGSGKHVHLNAGSGLANGATAGAYELGWSATWNANLPAVKATWDAAGSLSCDTSFHTWTSAAGANERRPIDCIDWYQAQAFCIWDGGFLPSEAEWNYAASGGTEQRVYPWGATAPTDQLAAYCGGSCSALQNVGSKPTGNGKWGQSDLAGNVWEWTLDGFKAPYNETRCTNCSYLGASSYQATRGGSFSNGTTNLLASYRGGDPPSLRSNNHGARCARRAP